MTVRILQVTSYPPPRAGWGVRVEHLKRQLESEGHECVVLNIGSSRTIPSPEYETVLGAVDYVRKVWRFSRRGFVVHMHVNGKSPKGLVLALVAEGLNLLAGHRCFLTFHAGSDQVYFPRSKAPALVPVFWLMFTLPRAIVCNDAEVKARIAQYGVSPRKITPISAFSVQYLTGSREPLPDDVERFYERFSAIVFCYMSILPIYFPVSAFDAFARVVAGRPDVGLVVCGVGGFRDESLWQAVRGRVGTAELRDRVLLVEDLPHGAFVEALRRSTVYLRTPPSDGVCSSVLEALTLRVPVLAAENGRRPDGVLTYPSENVDALSAALVDVLDRHDELARAISPPVVEDTLATEVALLTGRETPSADGGPAADVR